MRAVLMLALAPLIAFAQLGADRAATNRVFQSEEIVNEAWKKHIVTELLGEGARPELKDRMGAFVSAANLSALGVAAESAAEVAEAWMQGFGIGTQQLMQAVANSPTNGTWVKLCYPLEPSAARRCVDIFVVSNEYDSAKNRDEMWIYTSRELPMKPIVQIPYVSESGLTVEYVKGQATVNDVAGWGWTNTLDITRFGYTYAKCHRMWFVRPAALKDVPVFLNRHGSFGVKDVGFEWGSIFVTVTLPGQLPVMTYTGEITNSEGTVISVWKNGGFKGFKDVETEGVE